MGLNDKLGKYSEKSSQLAKEYGKKGATYIKELTINEYKSHTIGFIIVALILMIIGIIFVWWSVHKIVGFFSTPMGMVVLFMFIIAIALYLYLRAIGLKLNGWIGATIEISLLFLGIFFFVGFNQALAHLFMAIMPIVVIGALVYFFYEGLKEIKDENVRAFAIVMAIVLIVVIVIANAFVVPYIYGEQKILQVDLINTERPSSPLNVAIYLNDPYSSMTLTNSINPYIVGTYDIAHAMWVFNYKQYSLDVKVVDNVNNYRTIYTAHDKVVYVPDKEGGKASFYTVLRFPVLRQPEYDYTIYIYIYDLNHNLVYQTTYHYYGILQS